MRLICFYYCSQQVNNKSTSPNNELIYSIIASERNRRSNDGQARIEDIIGGGANAVHRKARFGPRCLRKRTTLQTGTQKPSRYHLVPNIPRKFRVDARSR